MNYIWFFLIFISVLAGIVNGKLPDVVNAILISSKQAVEISISLIGIMAFWLGMMKIAEKSGLVNVIARAISPLTKRIFDDVPKDNPAIGSIAMNFCANALGLSNAATPMGIKAMEELNKINKDKSSASNAMCTFLGINTAGFQLVPTTVLAVLVAAGAENPTEIIAPALIVTLIAFISAIIISKLLARVWTPQEEKRG